jgi:thioredoxin reductase (NADPH)
MAHEDETQQTPHVRDVVIIGSGPAGYTAAVYAARANLHPLVLAGSVTAGGALMNTTDVENFPGFPEGVLGPELMAKMQEQAERFGADVVYDDAEKVDLTADPKVVTTAEGDVYLARTVILATGSAYKELGVPGEKQLSGRGVSWCATCDGFFFRDQHILVVGGGDSAVEEATFLTRFAASVTVVHRRDHLRASAIMAERAMANPKISFAWNTTVQEIYGNGTVTGARLRDTVTGAERDVDTTGVFVAIGHLPRTELVAGQVELDEDGYIRVAHPTTATNIPGVFACGDVVDHIYRQAITAAGTGCAAALDAERYLAHLAHIPEAGTEPGASEELPAPAAALVR